MKIYNWAIWPKDTPLVTQLFFRSGHWREASIQFSLFLSFSALCLVALNSHMLSIKSLRWKLSSLKTLPSSCKSCSIIYKSNHTNEKGRWSWYVWIGLKQNWVVADAYLRINNQKRFQVFQSAQVWIQMEINKTFCIIESDFF